MSATKTDGSQTAVIDTEHTLATVTDAGNYVSKVDTVNMVLGDRLTLRVKEKIRSSGTTRLLYVVNYAHVQGTPPKESIPASSPHELVFTLEQTSGTGRVFEWEIVEIDG